MGDHRDTRGTRSNESSRDDTCSPEPERSEEQSDDGGQVYFSRDVELLDR